MKRKLKSQRGASITFALLIFLVCAVVGSVVLGAGTAAAGRISGLPKSDQRYYSVTSAARLFEEQFGGANITIERKYQYQETVTTSLSDGTVGAPVNVTGTDPYEDTISVMMPGDTTAKKTELLSTWTPDNLFTYLARQYVYGDNSTESADGWSHDAGFTEAPDALTLTADVDGDYDELDVAITATVSTSGNIQLDFVNKQQANSETNYRPYTLRMILSADIYNTNSELSNVIDTDVNSTSEIVTYSCTDTKKTSIIWNITSLEILGGGGTV